MSTRIIATFQITNWEQTSLDEPAEGPKLSRAAVTKSFTGDLTATSTADVLMCQAEGGAGYIAQERVEGRLGDRTGSFVLQHGGVGGGDWQEAFGHVVPGSGTGELKGLRGEARYKHDESGATLTLDYEFE